MAQISFSYIASVRHLREIIKTWKRHWTHNGKITFRAHTSQICLIKVSDSSHVNSPSKPRHNWEQLFNSYNYEISSVCPTSQVLLKLLSQLNLLCLSDVLSLFSLYLAPKGPLGEVTQKQIITEWYKYEKLKLISRDETEQQMSNTFFLWVMCNWTKSMN